MLITPLGYWLVTGHLTIKQNCRADLERLFAHVCQRKYCSLVAFFFFLIPSECGFRIFPMTPRPSCLDLLCLPFRTPVHPASSSFFLSCSSSCVSLFPCFPPSVFILSSLASWQLAKRIKIFVAFCPFLCSMESEFYICNQSWKGQGER